MIKTIMKKNTVVEYVEVNDEPIHKELFKNQYVRLYNATIQPGGQTLYHRHSEDTVYVVIQGGLIGTRNVGAIIRYPMDFPNSFGFFAKVRLGVRNLFTGSINMPRGFFFCMLHKKQPVIHKAVGSKVNLKDMVMIGTEILKKSNHDNRISLRKDFYKKDYESVAFSVFRLKLGPGQTTGYHTYNFPGLLIPFNGTICINTEDPKILESTNSILTPGEFRWHDCDTSLNISNARGEGFEAIIIALK